MKKFAFNHDKPLILLIFISYLKSAVVKNKIPKLKCLYCGNCVIFELYFIINKRVLVMYHTQPTQFSHLGFKNMII